MSRACGMPWMNWNTSVPQTQSLGFWVFIPPHHLEALFNYSSNQALISIRAILNPVGSFMAFWALSDLISSRLY